MTWVLVIKRSVRTHNLGYVSLRGQKHDSDWLVKSDTASFSDQIA